MLLVSSIDLIELNTNKMAFRPESNAVSYTLLTLPTNRESYV